VIFNALQKQKQTQKQNKTNVIKSQTLEIKLSNSIYNLNLKQI